MPPSSASVAALVAWQAGERRAATFVEDARSQRRVDYTQLAEQTRRWTAALDAAGAPVGGAVLLDVEDAVDAAVVLVAVLAAGRAAVSVDPQATVGDLARVAATAGGAVHVTDRPEQRVVPGLVTLTVTGADVPTPQPAQQPAQQPAPQPAPPPNLPETSPPNLPSVAPAQPTGPRSLPALLDGAGVVLPTSGSSGPPKLVPLREPALLHVAEAVATHNRLSPADRGYNPLPLFHVNAEVVAVLATLYAGATLVLDRRFHRTGFWELLADRRITWVNAVPAILGILAASGEPVVPTSLRFVRSASAALPARARAWVRDHHIALVESYGMTEAASQITATPLLAPGASGGAPEGSVGRPVGTELQIRTDDGLADPDVVGRVWIRGPGVITEYLGGRAVESFDAQGWLDTADLGRVDAQGWVFLVGRADDVINRGGELIYPREIEDVLRTHSRVRDVVVLGRPDDVLGEVPVALVVPVDAVPVDAVPVYAVPADRDALVKELLELCAGRLSRYKRPSEIALVAEFPRAATGKILRAQLGWP